MTDTELREIDAQAHREVMGKECYFVRDYADEAETEPWLGTFAANREWVNFDYMDVESSLRMPHYSSSIAAAWQVVEKLTGWEYVKVLVYESHYHGATCRVMAPDPTQRQDGCPVIRDGDSLGVPESCLSAPLAICLAALKAVSPKETSPQQEG